MREPDPVAAGDVAAPAAAPAPAAGLLRLRFGGLPWAVAGDAVCEVVGTERLQRNPRPAAGSPYGWLLGEREELPVYLPGERGPGNPGSASAAAVVVLQPAAGARCGLGVEAVDEVRREPISRLRLLPEPAASRRWAFPRVVLWDDGLALEIAPAAVPHLAAGASPTGGAEAGQSAAAAPLPAGAPRFDAWPWLPRASPSGGLFVFALPGGGSADFALPAAQVVEVLSAVAPRPVPGAPAPVLGLLAWRGEALPVVDLAWSIGLAPAPLPLPGAGFAHAVVGFAHAVVARAARSRQLLVFPVERLAGVRQGPFPQPATVTAAFRGARRVLGAFGDGERLLVVPDLDAALETFPVGRDAAGAASAWR